MRDYGKVSGRFWTGETGRELKAHGKDALIVGMYLMTSPHANMIGLYHLPKIYIAHETGLGIEGASEGLARCIEAGFCSYDDPSEHVFVHKMAEFQVGEQLDPKDKRCLGIAKELSKVPQAALQRAFWQRYHNAFNLPKLKPQGRGLEAPPKPRAGTGARTRAGIRARGAKSPLPENFSVSDRVKAWASEKGFDRLQEHCEAFCRKAKAKGYTYADWDSAFEEAIREDWAKLRAVNGSTSENRSPAATRRLA